MSFTKVKNISCVILPLSIQAKSINKTQIPLSSCGMDNFYCISIS